MELFYVEQEITAMTQETFTQKKIELVKQLESMKDFYARLGIDSKNIKTTFNLAIGYLNGSKSHMEVKAFFDTLMKNNKVMNAKELDLLVCMDNVVDSTEEEAKYLGLSQDNSDEEFRNVA